MKRRRRKGWAAHTDWAGDGAAGCGAACGDRDDAAKANGDEGGRGVGVGVWKKAPLTDNVLREDSVDDDA